MRCAASRGDFHEAHGHRGSRKGCVSDPRPMSAPSPVKLGTREGVDGNESFQLGSTFDFLP